MTQNNATPATAAMRPEPQDAHQHRDERRRGAGKIARGRHNERPLSHPARDARDRDRRALLPIRNESPCRASRAHLAGTARSPRLQPPSRSRCSQPSRCGDRARRDPRVAVRLGAGRDGVACAATGDAGALDTALRALRRRVLLHTAARDLTGRADLAEVCAAMTRLAELALRTAVDHHHRALADAHGEPLSADGQPQRIVVVGMGKLGGGELNVSSDIDLVFVYPEEGETAGPRRIANGEFFDRLGRRIIAALHDRTPDGDTHDADDSLGTASMSKSMEPKARRFPKVCR